MIGIHVVWAQEHNQHTHVSGGILTYGPATNELGYTFRVVHSLNMKPKFSTGLGLGYERFILNETQGNSFKGLPLFAQVKYVLNPNKKRSLFGSFDLGYSISLNKTEEGTNFSVKYEKSFNGGLLASPQVGLMQYTKNKKSHFVVSLGYHYQAFNEKMYAGWMNNNFFLNSAIKNDIIPDGYDNYTKSKYHLHRLSVLLGFGF